MSSEALELLLTRRSVKAGMLVEPGPSPEQLRTILTAAARVPDHKKLTPWRFIIFEGAARAAFGAALAAACAAEEKEPPSTVRLETERTRLTQAVVALQRLSTQPREALLFSSEAPIDAARSARLLGIITPELDARARSLQSDLNELHEMREQMAQERDQLAKAVTKLAKENDRLSDLIRKKGQAQKSTLAESASAQSKLEKLAGQAKNLQDLIDRLNKAKAETGPAAAPAPASQQVASAAAPGDAATAAQRMQQPTNFRNFPDAGRI